MTDASGGGAHVPMVILANKQLPAANNKTYFVADIRSAAEKPSGFQTEEGAQRIGGLCRMYPKTVEARAALLIRGLVLRGNTTVSTGSSYCCSSKIAQLQHVSGCLSAQNKIHQVVRFVSIS